MHISDLIDNFGRVTKPATVTEAKGLNKRVRIVKGSSAGKTGTIGEVRHGLYIGAPKTNTVDIDGGGNIQLPKEALRLIKPEEVAEAKAPTAKQVEAAKNKVDGFGLKIDAARKKAGYTRGATVGELQRKQGEAQAVYSELNRAYIAANK
mgnify:CR=1 FL=1